MDVVRWLDDFNVVFDNSRMLKLTMPKPLPTLTLGTSGWNLRRIIHPLEGEWTTINLSDHLFGIAVIGGNRD